MFDMSHPWWEFIVRAAIVFAALLVLVRVSGKRTVGQFTPFDLLVVMLLSEGVSDSLSGGDESVIGGLIIAATLIGLNLLLAYGSSRSQSFSNLVEGTSTLLGRDGVVYTEVMKKCRITESDVDEALREADCPVECMKYLFLEADGKITVLQKSPADVSEKVSV
jgi:uncharacterized membrane protein YcaP (DUF421 family)